MSRFLHKFSHYPNEQVHDYGWLAPDGTFYGCPFAEHEDIAEFVLKSDGRTLEEEKHFIKLYRDWPTGTGWYSAHKPTKAQKDYLLTRGLWDERDY